LGFRRYRTTALRMMGYGVGDVFRPTFRDRAAKDGVPVLVCGGEQKRYRRWPIPLFVLVMLV